MNRTNTILILVIILISLLVIACNTDKSYKVDGFVSKGEVYLSEEGKYSVKLPENWFIYESKLDNAITFLYSDNRDGKQLADKITIIFLEFDPFSLNNGAEKNDTLNLNCNLLKEFHNKVNTLEESNIHYFTMKKLIGKITVYKEIIYNTDIVTQTLSICITYNNLYYEFSFTSIPERFDEIVNIFYQTLCSFQIE